MYLCVFYIYIGRSRYPPVQELPVQSALLQPADGDTISADAYTTWGLDLKGYAWAGVHLFPQYFHGYCVCQLRCVLSCNRWWPEDRSCRYLSGRGEDLGASGADQRSATAFGARVGLGSLGGDGRGARTAEAGSAGRHVRGASPRQRSQRFARPMAEPHVQGHR